MKRPHIYIHADDYGMTPETCKRILDCRDHGCLNSISIMPNGCLKEKEELENVQDLDKAVHLNLVEGKALTPAEQIPLLVREDGYMKNSFFQLLLLSLSGKRKELEQEMELELKAQIHAVQRLLPRGRALMLDSHQHTHMIPLIFRVLLRIVKEEQLPVSYLRISAEPLLPFLREPSLFRTIQPVNLVKNLLLNFLWLFEKPAWKKSGIPGAIFCGILFSGHMDGQRVMKVVPHFYSLAKKKGMNLEFLFHPGYTEPGEELFDPWKKEFHSFYLSCGRKEEFDALHNKKLQRMLTGNYE
ncbi:MAG: ChbG/HpnK family deacetylase [Lachnospiraceae bacterium]|nr:ChbG/HpnK family deacetylase [Lachnospiraceae bacterium]